MAHTPGPWHAERRGAFKYSIFAPNPAAGTYVSLVRGVECRHDARLIAAAPDLLDALEKAVAWLTNADGDHPVLSAWLLRARAALAKAVQP